MNELKQKLDIKDIKIEQISHKPNRLVVDKWNLFYDEKSNPVKISYKSRSTDTLSIKISYNSKWVRFLQPIECEFNKEIYNFELVSGVLIGNQNCSFTPYIFSKDTNGKIRKVSKFTIKDGKYFTKAYLKNTDKNLLIGYETTDREIEVHIKNIELSVMDLSSYIEKNKNNIYTPEVRDTIYRWQGKQYKKLRDMNNKFSESARNNELDFLLDYAECLDSMEMKISFQNIIQYLAIKYNKFEEYQEERLKTNLVKILRMSEDKDFVYKLCEVNPELFFSLDIPTQKTVSIYANSSIGGYEGIRSDEKTVASVQRNQTALVELIKKKTENNEYSSTNDRKFYAALCNTVSKNYKGNELYVSYLNKVINPGNSRSFGISKLNLKESNIFNSIQFNVTKEIPGGPLISVIVSTYNSEQTIEYALRSIQNQTYKNIEILVCDDNSSDKTTEIINSIASQDERIKVYKSNENQGTYNIRNKLIQIATGHFITFHDSDDIALPDKLENQFYQAIENDRDVILGQWIKISKNGNIVFDSQDKYQKFCANSLFMDKNIVEKIPIFRSTKIGGDTEYIENIKKIIGEKRMMVVNLPYVLGLHRENSLTTEQGLEAGIDGFLSTARQKYSEIAAKQRVLGDQLVSNEEIKDLLSEFNIYKKASVVSNIGS